MTEERRTHQMFRHLATEQNEWFTAGPELLLHIVEVARGKYGSPYFDRLEMDQKQAEKVLGVPEDIDF